MTISKPLHYLIITCSSSLLFIWGLPNTIALRNILMILGALGSIYFLYQNRYQVFQKKSLALILMYCILIWVIFHFIFLSHDRSLQLLELKSLWWRVLAGMLMATATGFVIQKKSSINSIFPIAFFGMSISVFSVYLFHSLQMHHLISPNEFLDKYLFDRNKVGTAFFSVIDIAVGCAYISYVFFNKITFAKVLSSFGVFTLIAISLSASLIANSKNGMAIGISLFIILILMVFRGVFKTSQNANKYFGVFLIVTTLSFLFIEVKIHHKEASPGWNNLIPDIEVAIDIDHHQAWRGPVASGESYPKNRLGVNVASNTYERFSWMAAGFREVLKHPLGYGTINHASFPRWLKVDGISFDHDGATHCGWIDFALAFGVPAIGLALISILLIIKHTLTFANKPLWIYMAGWISLAVVMAPIVEEVTFKHTFEALMFFITFSAACLISADKNKSETNDQVG